MVRKNTPRKWPRALVAIGAALLLLVWSFSPLWLSVLLTGFWGLAFIYGCAI